jgi:hypothetical protein
LISIEEVSGGLRGYSQVLSPEIGIQTGWVYIRGNNVSDNSDQGWMQPSLGYWVFMVNPV